MLYLYETKISDNKRLDLCLKECFGIGHFSSRWLFVKFGFNNKTKQTNIDKRIKSNIDVILLNLINYIFFFSVEVFAKNIYNIRLKNLYDVKNFKSLRHFLKLPVRGQRTKNNAQTQKKKDQIGKELLLQKKKNKYERFKLFNYKKFFNFR